MSHKAWSLAHLFLASSALLAAVCMGCGQTETKMAGGAAARAGPADGVAPERFHTLTYEYVAQVLAMPSCTATVEEVAPCYASFKTEDGRMLCIGSPGAAPEVVGFVQTLQKGETYFLPDAFMKYQKNQREKPNKPDAGDGR
jgi:hypothetical protein